MKHFAAVAAVLLIAAGCENSKSKLDGVKPMATEKAGAPGGGATPVSAEADHSGDVETRLRRLEDNYAKYAEALDFLGKVYAQQKAQQAQQEASEPDPTAVFAVDIKENLAAGMYEGPLGAPVTIVEAFDFA
ncbi:MAG: hypothetical protein JNL83_24560 [Myxococcales bacterium]|nr:hypothetical protein [Myxococcales bacterium]